MMRLWQGNRRCAHSLQEGIFLQMVSKIAFCCCEFFSSPRHISLLLVFCLYLVISSVFAPNMKAGKGRRYLQPPSSESHHLQNLWTSRGDDDGDDDGDEERKDMTTKILKDLLNHCLSQEMSIRGHILSLDFNHHQFFLKRLFTLVGCRVTICVICITFNRKIRCFACACK